jgi:heme A synthase
VFVVLASGVLVVASGSPVRCLGWPLHGGEWTVAKGRQWLLLARLGLTGVASFLIVAVVVQAWRWRLGAGAILPTATSVGLLFLAEALVGALMVVYDPGIFLPVFHVAVTAALWATLVVLVMPTGLASSVPTEKRRVPW